MADLGTGAQVGLALSSGFFALVGVALSQSLSSRSRRAELDHEDRREAQKQMLASYSVCLALATEFDSRLDLFTPAPHELGALKSNVDLQTLFDEHAAKTGEPSPELPDMAPLVDSAALPGLKDLLARVTSSASTVEIVGSAAASEAVRDLVRAQRYWLLSLERDDPAAAADGLIQARPLLAGFRRVLANDFDPKASLTP